MKKLLLFLAAGGFCLNASAQSANGSMVRKDRIQADNFEKTYLQDKTRQFVSHKSAPSKAANKGTTIMSRWYNYVEHLGVVDASVFSNTTLPYMWFKPDMYGIYGAASGSGVELDTIRFVSYAMTFDALDSAKQNFNDPFYGDPSTTLMLDNTLAYSLDSVSVYGFYGRNSAKTNIVDTLRLSFIYGNGGSTNMPFYYFADDPSDPPPYWLPNYGYDTVRFGAIWHDPVNNVAIKYPNATTTTPSVIVKDIILDVNSLNDTDANGFNKFSVAVNMNVPARNYVGMTVTFKTGEAYTPYSDTVFVGSVNPNEPFKYNMFRPLFFEQHDGGFPSYTPGDWNMGHVKYMPESSSWDSLYVPSIAYTAPFNTEFPYIDFKLSANITSVHDIKNVAEVGNAYPNPATGELSIPFATTESANVNIIITNAVGATIATKNVGKINANQSTKATFNVASYANGVYFYTVEANGQRTTKRFVVAH